MRYLLTSLSTLSCLAAATTGHATAPTTEPPRWILSSDYTCDNGEAIRVHYRSDAAVIQRRNADPVVLYTQQRPSYSSRVIYASDAGRIAAYGSRFTIGWNKAEGPQIQCIANPDTYQRHLRARTG